MGFSWPVRTFTFGQYLFIVIVNIPNEVIKNWYKVWIFIEHEPYERIIMNFCIQSWCQYKQTNSNLLTCAEHTS